MRSYIHKHNQYMTESFECVDSCWAAFKSDTRMVEFWEILRKNNVPEDEGWKFLNMAWDRYALEYLNSGHLRKYKEEIDRERAIWEAINSFERDYKYLPEWLMVDKKKFLLNTDKETTNITFATNSQKQNPVTDLMRYLSDRATEIFGDPMHDAVTAVLAVLFDQIGYEFINDSAALKNLISRAKKRK